MSTPPREQLGVGVTLTGEFRWLPPTKANLATVFGVPVPQGFHRVPAPKWLVPGMSIIPNGNQPPPMPLPSRGASPVPSGVPVQSP
jgi:hypothetical protein